MCDPLFSLLQGERYPHNGPFLMNRCAKDLCPKFDFLIDREYNIFQYVSFFFKYIFGFGDPEVTCRSPADTDENACGDMTIKNNEAFFPFSVLDYNLIFDPNTAVHSSQVSRPILADTICCKSTNFQLKIFFINYNIVYS